jgi:hypothetical protein
MVDWAKELGIDPEALMFEDFSHPIARYENNRIDDRGEQFWEWYRNTHQEEPPVSDEPVMAEPRVRQYSFTDEQMARAMRSVREERSLNRGA